MRYTSTRGQADEVSASQAIQQGLASDGGLYVPMEPVKMSLDELVALAEVPYAQRAQAILSRFLTDYTALELQEATHGAYNGERFSRPEIAPVVELEPGKYILELWHGPTCAFKDMALQIMPRLLVQATAKSEDPATVVILVATSGDTGKAALEGFRDVPGTRIMVFYPDAGVSAVQERQMTTQEGENVSVAAVVGNFDDVQTGVKQIFQDESITETLQDNGFRFSSANSINWGRLVPQVVYYCSAYADLVKTGKVQNGEEINFVVPTGNFGNILAGYYAKQMGVPIGRLICAANANNVLKDFIRTGHYDQRRTFWKTVSPSMDILISSNLERLLYHVTGQDPDVVRDWMHDLIETGHYQVGEDVLERIQQSFWSGWTDDSATLETIQQTWTKNGYLLDTHTAVAKRVYDEYCSETGDTRTTVIISTASPFKFTAAVAGAILGEEHVVGISEFDLLEELSRVTRWPIPEALHGLDGKPEKHKLTVETEELTTTVLQFLGID